MRSEVKQRLVEFLSYKKIGQKAFAESVGLSAGFVNAIRVSIQPKTLEKIAAKYPELNTSWLLTGEGNMLRPTIEQKIGDVKDSELHEVNVVKGDPNAFNTLLRIVETHQKETTGFQRNIEKFQEQIDRLLNLLEKK